MASPTPFFRSAHSSLEKECLDFMQPNMYVLGWSEKYSIQTPPYRGIKFDFSSPLPAGHIPTSNKMTTINPESKLSNGQKFHNNNSKDEGNVAVGNAIDVDKLVDEVLQCDDLKYKVSNVGDNGINPVDLTALPDYVEEEEDQEDSDHLEQNQDIEIDVEDYNDDEFDSIMEIVKSMGPSAFVDNALLEGTPLESLYEFFELDMPSRSVRTEHEIIGYLKLQLDMILEEWEDEMAMDGQEEGGMTERQETKALEILAEIRDKGPMTFVDEQEALGASAGEFLSSIGFALPSSLHTMDHSSQWSFVKKFLLKYVYQRQRLPDISSFEDAVKLIEASKKILIITGAGISVSCGIPDFRSEHGLYASIKDRFNLPEPECMFDIEFFKDDPEPFFALAKVQRGRRLSSVPLIFL